MVSIQTGRVVDMWVVAYCSQDLFLLFFRSYFRFLPFGVFNLLFIHFFVYSFYVSVNLVLSLYEYYYKCNTKQLDLFVLYATFSFMSRFP